MGDDQADAAGIDPRTQLHGAGTALDGAGGQDGQDGPERAGEFLSVDSWFPPEGGRGFRAVPTLYAIDSRLHIWTQ